VWGPGLSIGEDTDAKLTDEATPELLHSCRVLALQYIVTDSAQRNYRRYSEYMIIETLSIRAVLPELLKMSCGYSDTF